MVGRLSRPTRHRRHLETKLVEVERIHEHIDRPHRIVRCNVILKARWQKARLVPAHAGLECANQHKKNRTLIRIKGYEYLPSLLGLSVRNLHKHQLTGAEDRATLDNPLGTRLSPMSPVHGGVHP